MKDKLIQRPFQKIIFSGLTVILLFLSSLSVQAQEPVTRQWLEAMWSNSNTRHLIEPAIKEHGIAFLPIRTVRDKLLAKGIDSKLVDLLKSNFARRLTFMVCKFTCDNCGTSTAETTTFNQLLFDKTFYSRKLALENLSDPLHGKTLHQSLGPADGPPPDFEAVVLVFITGHLHWENGAFRIVPRLFFRDQGGKSTQLETTDIVSAATMENTRIAANNIATWAIGTLKRKME